MAAGGKNGDNDRQQHQASHGTGFNRTPSGLKSNEAIEAMLLEKRGEIV